MGYYGYGYGKAEAWVWGGGLKSELGWVKVVFGGS